MDLGDFREKTKGISDSARIFINGSESYFVEYREFIYSQVPTNTPYIATGEPFIDKKLVIECFK